MVFELPAGGTTTNEANILTKIPNALNALRDGSSNHYAGSTGNAVGGTANAITLTTDTGSPAHTAYVDGHAISIRPGSTNTSGSTIALDGLAAKAILKREAGALVALVAGDIVLNIEARLLFSTQSDAWILESNPNVALLNAPNLHTADIGVKNTAGTVQRRTHLDPRTGNENQIWDGTNIWHNGTIWKFDDDTKPAYLQIFDMVGDEIAHYHAPANPGFDPALTKIASLSSSQMLLKLATAKLALDSTGGANPRLDFLVNGVQKSSLRAEEVAGSNDLILYDLVGGGTRVRWDMNTGKQTAGTVPHGRTLNQFNASSSTALASIIPFPVIVGDIIMVFANGIANSASPTPQHTCRVNTTGTAGNTAIVPADIENWSSAPLIGGGTEALSASGVYVITSDGVIGFSCSNFASQDTVWDTRVAAIRLKA